MVEMSKVQLQKEQNAEKKLEKSVYCFNNWQRYYVDQ